PAPPEAPPARTPPAPAPPAPADPQPPTPPVLPPPAAVPAPPAPPAPNVAPSFSVAANKTALEDSGAHSVASWVAAISPGPASELTQSVSFSAVADVPGLFAVQPAI